MPYPVVACCRSAPLDPGMLGFVSAPMRQHGSNLAGLNQRADRFFTDDYLPGSSKVVECVDVLVFVTPLIVVVVVFDPVV